MLNISSGRRVLNDLGGCSFGHLHFFTLHGGGTVEYQANVERRGGKFFIRLVRPGFQQDVNQLGLVQVNQVWAAVLDLVLDER